MKFRSFTSVIFIMTIFIFFFSATILAEEETEKTKSDEKTLSQERAQTDLEDQTAGEKGKIEDPVDEHLSYLEKERAKIQAEKRTLALLRADVKKDIQRMEKLQKQLNDTLNKKDEIREKRILKLVKVYQKMQPSEAVKLLNNINEDLMLSILFKMKEKQQGKILSLMEPTKAAIISEKLINGK